MGTICIERETGRLREWVRHGAPAQYNPAEHMLLEAELPPPDGMRWDGTAWVPLPPRSAAEKDAALQDFLNSTAGLAMQAVVTALVKKGVITLAEIRAEWRTIT